MTPFEPSKLLNDRYVSDNDVGDNIILTMLTLKSRYIGIVININCRKHPVTDTEVAQT